eukprot:gnl/MRDRNA2_/MRDRNA2_147218_c0_seq1.p1 gnl/MRDRNA2_/MRDRNA2_147218_c0~~gnl/MRDRNA2_/MRDRNA2_147218_c0_seq1.p1  ORF type:complete len:350 (-),score=64.97 gnl/MRDRNA2_/MRDRNA2_147218_c0_seq1:87-1109(-)
MGAEDAELRDPIIAAFLNAIHNLCAACFLATPGRMLGRHFAVLWPRFGHRFLVPHIRRLMNRADGSWESAAVAGRMLRHNLRTLGWLLYHSPEFRRPAAAFTAELAMRALKQQLSMATLAVHVALASNAGALMADSALAKELKSLDAERKTELFTELTSEVSRLHIIKDAYAILANLGLWCPNAQGNNDNYDPFAEMNFHGDAFVDFDWGDDDDEEEDLGLDSGEATIMGSGPIGYFELKLPEKHQVGGPDQMPGKLVCTAPEKFRCAIDGRICRHPVRSPSGILYERKTILFWLTRGDSGRQYSVCPVNGMPLTAGSLTEDHVLSANLGEWLRAAQARS